MDQPRSRAVPSSLRLSDGGHSRDGTQPGSLYTHYTDKNRTSSSATSTHELLEKDKGWALSDSPKSAINSAFPPPTRASYDTPVLPPRRVITEKDRWVCLTQYSPASPSPTQPNSPLDAHVRRTL